MAEGHEFKIANLNGRLLVQEESHEKTMADLRSQVSSNKSALSSANAELAKRDEEAQSLHRTIDDLRSKILLAQAEVAGIRASRDAADALRSQITELETALWFSGADT